MTNLIIRLFIKDYENTSDPVVRRRYGGVSSLTGILCNLLLFGAKMVIGILARSIAITADAVNNLSDTGSSVITLIIQTGRPNRRMGNILTDTPD